MYGGSVRTRSVKQQTAENSGEHIWMDCSMLSGFPRLLNTFRFCSSVDIHLHVFMQAKTIFSFLAERKVAGVSKNTDTAHHMHSKRVVSIGVGYIISAFLGQLSGLTHENVRKLICGRLCVALGFLPP